MSYEKTYKFGVDFAWITLATMATYSWFTIRTTAWRYVLPCFMEPTVSHLSGGRTRFRQEANQADNKAATSAVDSLINYEAVKVRGRQLDGGQF